MKAVFIKKIAVAAVTTAFVFASVLALKPVAAYAAMPNMPVAPVAPPVPAMQNTQPHAAAPLDKNDAAKTDTAFNITSGIVKDKETESTFDLFRTIVGVAQDKTVVTITVSQNVGGSMKEVSRHVINVGAYKTFSQKLDLALGENHVTITAELNGVKNEMKAVIKRIDKDVQQKLEQNIAIPGMTVPGTVAPGVPTPGVQTPALPPGAVAPPPGYIPPRN